MEPVPPPAGAHDAVPTSGDRRLAMLGLAAGASAALAFIVQIVLGVEGPVLVLTINLGLAAGAYGLLLLQEASLRQAGDAGILQFLGYVAIVLLGRVWLGQTAQGVAILFEYSLSLAALAIATGCVLFRLLAIRNPPRIAARTNAFVGAAAFAALTTALLLQSPSLRGTDLALLSLVILIVAATLGIQWFVARGFTWVRARAWATPISLALAGTQLFDGVLTYLVVEDPLGIAPIGFEEQIPASRFLLDAIGIGFPLAKWALALVVTLALAQSRFRRATDRIAVYLAILAAGMGPGLYSAAQLF